MLIIIFSSNNEEQINYFGIALKKQTQNFNNYYLKISFKESLNELRHSQEPWQQTNYKISGNYFLGKNYFSKIDTLTRRSRKYFSKTFWNTNKLYFIDYGQSKKQKITESLFNKQIFKILPYSPISIFKEFKKKILEKIENMQFINK